MLEYLKLKKNDFIEKYCRWISLQNGREYLSLTEKKNYDCIFWNKGCTIYNVRPLQCKNFPFWHYALDSFGAWKALVSDCKAFIKIAKFEKNTVNFENIYGKKYPASVAKNNCKLVPLSISNTATSATKESLQKMKFLIPYRTQNTGTFFSGLKIAEIRNEQLTAIKISRRIGQK